MTGFSKHLLKECGCDVRIAPSVVITHPDLVCIGDHVAIDDFVYVSTGLSIGKYSHIGPHSSIIGGPATGTFAAWLFTSTPYWVRVRLS